MKIAQLTWGEVRKQMAAAGVNAVVPLAMIDLFEQSRLKFYGYGSRFNGSRCRPDSDWDLLVVCTATEWEQLKSNLGNKLGMWLYDWKCEKQPGQKGTQQPVLCNYRIGQGGKNAVNVRKIDSPDTDLYYKTSPPRQSDYTDIT